MASLAAAGGAAPGAPLAVSLGDPAGVGPEVIAKAWAVRAAHLLPPFFAIGDRRSLEAVWAGPIVQIAHPQDAVAAFDEALPLLQVDDPGRTWPARAVRWIRWRWPLGWRDPVRRRDW
jgi:4-hydroxythreonine-4-phosphate dehydrogenase